MILFPPQLGNKKDDSVFCIADEWVKCDDDKMSTTTTEQILKLSGGGKFSKAVFTFGVRALVPEHWCLSTEKNSVVFRHWKL